MDNRCHCDFLYDPTCRSSSGQPYIHMLTSWTWEWREPCFEPGKKVFLSKLDLWFPWGYPIRNKSLCRTNFYWMLQGDCYQQNLYNDMMKESLLQICIKKWNLGDIWQILTGQVFKLGGRSGICVFRGISSYAHTVGWCRSMTVRVFSFWSRI